ncbi:hypothetical protein MBANPS3_005694 [Mucor bainieri]
MLKRDVMRADADMMDTDHQEQPGVAPTLSFASKDSNELRAMRELTLRHVASELAMAPQDAALLLLRFFLWNREALIEQYLADPEAVLTDAGLQVVSASSSRVTSLECENYHNDEPRLEIFHVACNHLFCRECYWHYLSEKVEQGDLSTLQCPHEGCKAAVVELIVIYHQYHYYIAIQSYRTKIKLKGRDEQEIQYLHGVNGHEWNTGCSLANISKAFTMLCHASPTISAELWSSEPPTSAKGCKCVLPGTALDLRIAHVSGKRLIRNGNIVSITLARPHHTPGDPAVIMATGNHVEFSSESSRGERGYVKYTKSRGGLRASPRSTPIRSPPVPGNLSQCIDVQALVCQTRPF